MKEYFALYFADKVLRVTVMSMYSQKYLKHLQ